MPLEKCHPELAKDLTRKVGEFSERDSSLDDRHLITQTLAHHGSAIIQFSTSLPTWN